MLEVNIYRVSPVYIAQMRRFPAGQTLALTAAVVVTGLVAFASRDTGQLLFPAMFAAFMAITLRTELKRRRIAVATATDHKLWIEGDHLHASSTEGSHTIALPEVGRILVQRARGQIESLILEIGRTKGKVKLSNYDNMEGLLSELRTKCPPESVQERRWWHVHF